VRTTADGLRDRRGRLPREPDRFEEGEHGHLPAGYPGNRSRRGDQPSAPGGVGLQEVIPQPGLTGAQALAVMTEPVTVDWGPVQAVAICVT